MKRIALYFATLTCAVCAWGQIPTSTFQDGSLSVTVAGPSNPCLPELAEFCPPLTDYIVWVYVKDTDAKVDRFDIQITYVVNGVTTISPIYVAHASGSGPFYADAFFMVPVNAVITAPPIVSALLVAKVTEFRGWRSARN